VRIAGNGCLAQAAIVSSKSTGGGGEDMPER
jgi:hypothetical protein